jgi:hypothetical protein
MGAEIMPEGGGRKRIPSEALLDLRRRLAALPPRHPDRQVLIENAAGRFCCVNFVNHN